MKEIFLTNGGVTLVSDEDYHWLSQRAWYKTIQGYVICDLFGGRKGKSVLMHRLILLAPDTSTVDHINHNPLDNRRENLRLATQQEQNRNKVRTFGTSRFKGVYRRRDGIKWCAQIGVNNRKIYLGSFENEIDAAACYNDAAVRLFGDFACLNKLDA